MTYAAWERKMLRGFAAYVKDIPEDVDKLDCRQRPGVHYCQFYKRLKRNGRAQSQAKFESTAQIPGCGQDTFRPALRETLLSLLPTTGSLT